MANTSTPRTAASRQDRGCYPNSFTIRATLLDANVSVVNPNAQAESNGQ